MALPFWTWDAACRGADTYLFYGADERGKARQARETEAKRYCRHCPTRAACLDYALAQEDWNGIWGGLTPDERRDEALRRRIGYVPGRPAPAREKRCIACHQVMASDLFGKDATTKDGLRKACKRCSREASRERRARERADRQVVA